MVCVIKKKKKKEDLSWFLVWVQTLPHDLRRLGVVLWIVLDSGYKLFFWLHIKPMPFMPALGCWITQCFSCHLAFFLWWSVVLHLKRQGNKLLQAKPEMQNLLSVSESLVNMYCSVCLQDFLWTELSVFKSEMGLTFTDVCKRCNKYLYD